MESLVVERRAELLIAAARDRGEHALDGADPLWGLEEAVRAGGVDVEWLMLAVETLADAGRAASTWPDRPADARAGRGAQPDRARRACPRITSSRCCSPTLRSNGARVELGTEVIGVRPVRDGVRVDAARTSRPGDERHVRARYLIAADGAHSRVRAELGIAMRGPDGLGDAVTAVFRAPLWQLVGEHRYGIYDVNHPDARGRLPARRARRPLAATASWVDPARTPSRLRTPERFTRRIRRRRRRRRPAGRDRAHRRASASPPSWPIASATGSVFLVGDAAHRVTPRGGTGMNTAIHDGYDLGWKLGWVLRGWAQPALLDTYEAERRPVAEHNVARSADPAGSRAKRRRAARRPRRPHPARVGSDGSRAACRPSTSSGPGSRVFTGPEGGRWAAPEGFAADRVPVTLRRVDPIAARALGLRGGEALVVRPDGMRAAAAAAGARPQAAAA